VQSTKTNTKLLIMKSKSNCDEIFSVSSMFRWYISMLSNVLMTAFHHHVISVDLNCNVQWCSPRDQGLGLEPPRRQKWKSWSWSWSWTFGHGLGLEENVLQQFFKTFVVILDGSEQGTTWHFVRDNKSSLPFGSYCLRELSALHAHQSQLRGYLTMVAIF